MLSTGHGRKTDQADALSAGIAAHTATRLSTAVAGEATAALRVLTEHRDDLVRARTQTISRLHALLAQLVPAGLPRGRETP
jgi:transposase